MKMFFIIPVAIGAVLLLTPACNRAELEQAKHERDSLRTVASIRDSMINDFIISFNEVESNLDSVAVKQHLITSTVASGREFQTNQKMRINAEIEAINNLMEANRKTIADLTRKLKTSSNKNIQFEKTIATLNRQLTQKFFELTLLNDELNLANAQVAQLKTSIDTLTAQNLDQSQTIAEEMRALHTAYYVVGKSKELQDEKLIDRKGGLLGIGKTSQLTENFDNSKFTRIDYTQTSSISINSKEVKIITTHPSDSYTLNKDINENDVITNLVITNPEKFWSVSKYLVVIKS